MKTLNMTYFFLPQLRQKIDTYQGSELQHPEYAHINKC